MSDTSSELAAAKREIDRLRTENFGLRRSLSERERKVSDLLSSTSWRITAPLRALVDVLRERRWLRRRPAPRSRSASFEIDRDEYQRWVQSYSSVDAAMRAHLVSAVESLAARPLISVIMPSYNIDPQWMREAIESVRRQIYPHWELCISDDASTRGGVRPLLESYAAQDKRIRIAFRPANGHISANSNSALDLAGGDYVALLDADDVLTEDALFWVAHEIALDPQTDMIFSDEDKIGPQGRFDPYFKPAWNTALMLGQNAFCHLGVFRRSLVEQVGRFREGREGAQDHDLALRCADATTPERIRHIPRILYHWRATAQSTAATLETKPYAQNAGLRTIEDHLRRKGIKGSVELAGNFYQVFYQVPEPAPLVSIIVPTTLRNSITQHCLQSVLTQTRYKNFELLLLATEPDLAAGRAAFADLLADRRVRALTYAAASFNYSWVNNFGVAQAHGSLLCFLNDDVEVISEEWLDTLVARASLDGVGAAGPMLYYPSGQIQHAGVLLGIGGVADHAFRNFERGQAGYFSRATLEQDYSCVTAACMVVRRAVFEQIGGFDVDLPTAFNDVDFCIRLRRTGARIVWTPAAQLYHHESLTFGAHNSPQRAAQFERDVLMLRERWEHALDNDPAYNPNLSFDREHQFRLAVAPRAPFTPGAILLGTAVSRTARLV
jgi:GT2 family glycosyltransferase